MQAWLENETPLARELYEQHVAREKLNVATQTLTMQGESLVARESHWVAPDLPPARPVISNDPAHRKRRVWLVPKVSSVEVLDRISDVQKLVFAWRRSVWFTPKGAVVAELRDSHSGAIELFQKRLAAPPGIADGVSHVHAALRLLPPVPYALLPLLPPSFVQRNERDGALELREGFTDLDANAWLAVAYGMMTPEDFVDYQLMLRGNAFVEAQHLGTIMRLWSSQFSGALLPTLTVFMHPPHGVVQGLSASKHQFSEGYCRILSFVTLAGSAFNSGVGVANLPRAVDRETLLECAERVRTVFGAAQFVRDAAQAVRADTAWDILVTLAQDVVVEYYGAMRRPSEHRQLQRLFARLVCEKSIDAVCDILKRQGADDAERSNAGVLAVSARAYIHGRAQSIIRDLVERPELLPETPQGAGLDDGRGAAPLWDDLIDSDKALFIKVAKVIVDRMVEAIESGDALLPRDLSRGLMPHGDTTVGRQVMLTQAEKQGHLEQLRDSLWYGA
jgi:hypothetical protein